MLLGDGVKRWGTHTPPPANKKNQRKMYDMIYHWHQFALYDMVMNPLQIETVIAIFLSSFKAVCRLCRGCMIYPILVERFGDFYSINCSPKSIVSTSCSEVCIHHNALWKVGCSRHSWPLQFNFCKLTYHNVTRFSAYVLKSLMHLDKNCKFSGTIF